MTHRLYVGGRSIPIWLLILLIIATGAGAALGTVLSGEVTGEIPITVSQSILVGEPMFPDTPPGITRQTFRITPVPPDRSIGIVTDDSASFRAAAELDVGDVYLIQLPLKNASEQDLTAELTMVVPDCIEVEVFASDEENQSAVDHTVRMTRVGLNTWNFRVSYLTEFNTSDWRDSIGIAVGVDDHCMPGFYNIEAHIKQIPGTHTNKPSLILTKSAPELAPLSSIVNYMITIKNDGDADATLVTVVDTLPSGMTYVSSSPVAVLKGNQVTWNIDSIPVNSSRVLFLDARATHPGEWINTVKATSAEKVSIDAEAKTKVPSASLNIQKTGPPLRPLGSNAIYNILVQNIGDSDLTNVVVTDSIPAGMNYVDSNPQITQLDGQKVIWRLGTLFQGQQKKLTLILNCRDIGTWLNSVTVTTDEGLSETDSAQTIVDAQAGGMTVQVIDSVDPIGINDKTTYIIAVSNQGQLTLHNMQIVNTIPDKMSFESADGPTTHNIFNRTVTFNPVASIAPGESLIFNITVKAISSGNVVNKVKMTFDEFQVPVSVEEGTSIFPSP